MPSPRPLSVIESRTDKEYAAEIRDRLLKAFEPVIEIMTEASRSGIDVQFNVGPDWRGLPTIQRIVTVKKLD
jgi:hypothetical protein